MKAVLQRVSQARVEVEGQVTGSIGRGLVVLLGIARTDTPADADYLAEKIIGLRVFPDDEGKMNRSLMEIGGGLLVISQFTLYGDTRKGRRPSFDAAAPPDQARALYEYFLKAVRSHEVPYQAGIFQAMMDVHLVNEGPVTIICESPRS
jgi:D-tyrosyl-tRNA(Tyr) deacylase